MTLFPAALSALLSMVARAQSVGGDFLLDTQGFVVTESALLEGAGMALSPSAGDFTAGLVLEGAGFSLAPAPIFSGLPAPSARKDLSVAHAYPVPFRPLLGHSKITFTGLTRDAAVTIYTPTGERVRTLRKSDEGPSLDWSPIANDNGERTASGLYLYVIKDSAGEERRQGKLIIVR